MITSSQAREPDVEEAVLLATLGKGLQLARAGTLATTRLQLALTSGDRRHAMEVMDRLLDIDAAMDALITEMPIPHADDPDWRLVKRHLGEQKVAIAFERLALASEVTGPDLISSARLLPQDGENGDHIDVNREQPMAAIPTAPWKRHFLLALGIFTLIGMAIAIGIASM